MKKRIAALLLTLALAFSGIPATALGANINRLEGVDRLVYDALETQIMEVSAGTRESAVFTFPASAFGVKAEGYTAEELGVSAIVANNAITTESVEALDTLLEFDLAAVLSTLLAAHPFDLYWYDKTAGTQMNCTYSYGANNRGGVWRLLFTEETAITLSMAVAQEYAADAGTVDTAKTAAAWAVRATPEQIVAANAAKSDYEKLEAYRAAICAIVSLNNAAADAANATPYGNPWQPVWVFDGDDSTTVVCEGYAKAFQYLCDLTSFRSDAVRCYTVSGRIEGGTGSGRHMWNIVTMDDGANYLVDVTNCDAGTVGADDLLFLKGYTTAQGMSYTWRVNGSSVSYTYDEATQDLYTAEELTVSGKNYEIPAPPAQPAFEGVQLSLRDDIALRFIVDMADVPSDGAYMSFSWGDGKTAVDYPALLQSGSYAGKYIVTCPLAAKELEDTVHAALVDGDNKTLAEYDYSAAEYLTELMGGLSPDDAAYQLADAVRQYGAAARAYFSGGPAVTVAEVEKVEPTYLTDDMTLSDGAFTFYGKSLLTKSTLRLRLYFTAPAEAEPTVLIDGAAVTLSGSGDGLYWADIPLSPMALLSGHQVEMSGTAVKFTVGVTDYLAQALEGGSEPLVQLSRAIYRYAAAAAALRPATDTGDPG